MKDYTILSIETHLFFARIMKEHGIFLEAGFPCCQKELTQEAEHFHRKFAELLGEVLRIAEGNVHESVICSHELATEFTLRAEQKTEALSGIPISCRLTEEALNLRPGCSREEVRLPIRQIDKINEQALRFLNDFIRFQENILCKVKRCQLFTFNYPLLLRHILREARLYRDIVEQLMGNRSLSYQNLYETETFWNQIMMEHAWFIRGLLDPTEKEFIKTADEFSEEYARLLHAACKQDCRADSMAQKALKETLRYRDFKASGTKGILDCQISSVILPLLADHVLREANHYIRILKTGRTR